MKVAIISCVLLLASTHVFAAKPCEELRDEIKAKLEAKRVPGYKLDIVDNDKVSTIDKVVGSCDGGTKKIIYSNSRE